MPKPPAQRKIEGYHLNVFIEDEPLQEYGVLASMLVEDSPHNLKSATRHFAFRFFEDGGLVACISHEGDPDAEALLYDTATGVERNTRREKNEIVATRTHFALSLPSRVVAFEYNHRGTKVGDFANVCEQLLSNRSGVKNVQVTLVPIPGPTFLEQLNEYERIQSAKAMLVRPNAGWLDADSPLFEYGESSNAKTMTVEAKAGRGEGLARRRGIVNDVRRVVRDGITTLREAVFWGTKHGRREELRLSSHIQKTVVQLPRMADGQPNGRAMLAYVVDYCGRLAVDYPVPKRNE